MRFKLLCLAHDIMGQTNSLLTKKKKITRAAEPKPLNFKRKKKKKKQTLLKQIQQKPIG